MYFRRKKGAVVRPRRKPKYAPYRSAFEKRLHEGVLNALVYEPKEHIKLYTSFHKYNPDFVHPSNPRILLEAKGRFRPGEQRKYLDIKRDNPDIEIVFIFMNPDVMAGTSKVTTMAKWADKHGFRWFHYNNIPLEIQLGDTHADDNNGSD